MSYCAYVESKKNYTNEHIYKNRNRFTDQENGLMVTRGEVWEGGIDWEFETDMCTLSYLK